MIFTCPNCHELLRIEGRSYICPNGHSHDISKEGYVHLLPVNKMHSKIPGDTKEMIAARRSFLNSGGYDIFLKKLCKLAYKYNSDIDKPVLLDCGCGEGYYLRGIEQYFNSHNKDAEYYGFDISKFAVKAASKQQKTAVFCVGSIFNIPAADESADCAVNIFAPMVEAEFFRILKNDGIMIFAVPSERHLFGLKEVLYENPYENEKQETEYEGFKFISRESVRGEITICGEQIMNLFSMTPYYWKTPREGSKALSELTELTTEIGFDFLIYRKEK